MKSGSKLPMTDTDYDINPDASPERQLDQTLDALADGHVVRLTFEDTPPGQGNVADHRLNADGAIEMRSSQDAGSASPHKVAKAKLRHVFDGREYTAEIDPGDSLFDR